jgi:hypothetical protein
LYGNEQQKVAAAVTKATEQNKINNEEVPEELEPSVSVDTTIEQKSSPCDAQEDPCHDVGLSLMTFFCKFLKVQRQY